MCSPPAISVDDDLAPSQASVTMGTANHKSTREGEEIQGLTGELPSAVGWYLTQTVAATAVHPVFIRTLPQYCTSALLQPFGWQAGGLCNAQRPMLDSEASGLACRCMCQTTPYTIWIAASS